MRAGHPGDERGAGRLAPALAASISVHLVVIALASIAISGTPAHGDPRPPLAVRLAPRSAPSPPATAPPVAVNPSPADRDSILAIAGRGRTPAPRLTPREPAAPQENTASHLGPGAGSIAVETSSVLARLGEELEHRLHNEFGFEVDAPVRLPGKPSVAYPPRALAERREAVVVAWIVVAADGSVEDVRTPDAGTDFAEAIALALRDARFRPAVLHGEPIRYFTMLEFDFRIGASTGKATALSP